jgi:hypothetical protein
MTVVPLGIKHVIRQVKTRPRDEYLAAGISPAMRSLPDFFISNGELSETWLLEVKYRREWNQKTRLELAQTLLAQVKQWQPPLDDMQWLDMSLVQRVFPGLSEQFTQSTLVKATSLVRQLADLDLIDAA